MMKVGMKEIKTNYSLDFEKIKLQLYYESNGRPTYVLHFDWQNSEFVITKVDFISEDDYKEIKSKKPNQRKSKSKKLNIKEFCEEVAKNSNNSIEVVFYKISKADVRCSNCNYKWEISTDYLLDRYYCPKCNKNKK